MSIFKKKASRNLARAGVSVALAVAAIGGLASTSQATTVNAVSLSATTGPNTGANTITLTLGSTATPKFTNTAHVGVVFQAAATSTLQGTAACTTNPAQSPAATVAVNSLLARFLTTTKVSALVPDLSGGGTSYWVVCVYNDSALGSSATILGRGVYTTMAPPVISGITVTPNTGPSIGGQTITVTGASALPTTAGSVTATLGGVALTSVTPIDATSFTAVTPAEAYTGSASSLVVTTIGGSATKTSAYTYANGITVSPNTVVSGSSVDVDIQGVGFSALTFGATDATTSSTDGSLTGTNSANAHVYLVKDTYLFTGYVAGTPKSRGQVGECENPAVISDTELICTVNAAHSISNTSLAVYTYHSATAEADGTYTITVVNNGSIAPTYQTAVSSGATFTVANF